MHIGLHDLQITGSPHDEYFMRFNNEGKYYDDVAFRVVSLLQHERRDRITVLDVGANIGLFALHVASFAHSLKKDVDIYCFEPSPVTFYHLSQNVERSPFREMISIHNMGCGARSGILKLHELTESQSGSYISSHSGGVHPHFRGVEHTVQMTTLDEFARDKPFYQRDLVVVKVDVEGFEDEVIRGSKVLTALDQAVTILEFNPWVIKTIRNECPRAFLSFVLESFKFCYVCDGRRVPGYSFDEIRLDTVDALFNSLPNEFSMMDIVCTNSPISNRTQIS